MAESYRIAGSLLISTTGELLLQRRDNKPHVSSPGMLSVFGGLAEDGESLEQTMLRELAEETGLVLESGQCEQLMTFILDRPGMPKVEGGFFLARNIPAETMKVTEGRLEIVTREAIGALVEQIVPTTMLAISTYLSKPA